MLLSVSYTFSACGTTADSSQKSKYFNDCIASPFFFYIYFCNKKI